MVTQFRVQIFANLLLDLIKYVVSFKFQNFEEYHKRIGRGGNGKVLQINNFLKN
jgi:hypothetical protein